jgi:hypothetical protein
MDDFLQDCMTDLGVQEHRDFQTTFCVRCRNPQCLHAKWATDKFGERVATQLDRYFNPIQADISDPQYQGLEDFISKLREGKIQVESDRRGDWTVPEIPVTDGVSNKTESEQTSSVDDAAQQLSRVRGGEDLNLPDPLEAEVEAYANEPEPPAPEPVAPEPPPAQEPPASVGNTEVPNEGMMVGGGAVPPARVQEKVDPWATPKKSTTKVVKPGAKIKMGDS